MRLILDSHIVLALTLKRTDRLDLAVTRILDGDGVRLWASAASLWEIAIKTRLGKLDPACRWTICHPSLMRSAFGSCP